MGTEGNGGSPDPDVPLLGTRQERRGLFFRGGSAKQQRHILGPGEFLTGDLVRMHHDRGFRQAGA